MSLKGRLERLRVPYKVFQSGQTGKVLLYLMAVSLTLSCSQKKGASQEDHQARFYADYRKVAEEYDKDFLDKYDEDLNTTLIFVSITSSLGGRALIKLLGWSIFCCRLRVHHRSRPPATTGLRRRDSSPPPRPHLQDR